MPNQQPIIILFDGVCNLCNGFVNFLIDRDRAKLFKFASLQSDFGENILSKNNLQTNDYQSVIVLESNQLFSKSSAIFKIIERLPYWRCFRIFKILPSSVLDTFYELIARNRYRIFGKQASCRIPTPELRERFLG